MCADKNCFSSSSSDSSESSCDSSSSSESSANCEKLTPCQIFQKYKNAVVDVYAQFVLIGTAGPTGVTGGTPLGPDIRTDVVIHGNGFFINRCNIVLPSHLVLMPPSLTSLVQRYPLYDPTDVTFGQIKNQMIRASQILVTVHGVGQHGKSSFVYRADLVGVDGAGDVALLSINRNDGFNRCNPCLDKQCHFKFHSSCGLCPGDDVFLFGDYTNHPRTNSQSAITQSMIMGKVVKNNFVEHSGFVLPELLVVDAGVYKFSSGMPIVNEYGGVIAMQTTSNSEFVFGDNTSSVTGTNQPQGAGLVSGPTERFMKRIIYTLIKGSSNRDPNYKLNTVEDGAGSYYRYRKGYMGVAYDVFEGNMYTETVDFTSGLPESGFPRLRVDSEGNFPSGPKCKIVQGIRVLGLAGLNPLDVDGITGGYWYVPGGTGAAPLVDFLPNSPLLNRLHPGDVIVRINKFLLGNGPERKNRRFNKSIFMMTPSAVTWRTIPNDKVEVTYRRSYNVVNAVDNGVPIPNTDLNTYTFTMGEFPPVMDYPWYAVDNFPLLINRAFTFPGTQSTVPQFPSLASPAPGFHPAL